MSDIPQEIIGEILKRLPVKSLLRFRCVSKPWRSLIDSSDFIKLHLHSFEKSNSNLTLVVEGSELFYVDLDTFKNLGTGNTRFDALLVVPSCNGLVLVVSMCKDLLLWNPATRKLNKLPTTPLDYEKSSRACYVMESYALGYDSKHDDYKVVRVLRAADAGRGVVSSQAKVYSLKSNSWKMIEAFQYTLPPEGWGVYLNDALHTVVGHNYNCLEAIMAFDLVKEKHFEVPKPGFSGAKRGFASVEVMGGFLTLVVPEMMNNSEIWVMKEYGVKESWTKLLCFEPLLPFPCTYLRPLAYSKSGDEVLFNYERMGLVWYHLRKKTATLACDRDLMECFEADSPDPTLNTLVCMQSLVSPHSPGSGVASAD